MRPLALSKKIVVAGSIGVGKTTLADVIAATWGYTVEPEPHAENPYLADFYADMPRWAFHSQVFFLARRMAQHLAVQRDSRPTVQDRSLYEDAEVFAWTLHKAGQMNERDWRTYHDLYAGVSAALKPPDLVVYLHAPLAVLKARIARRGREFEASIDDGYLSNLTKRYEQWAGDFKGSRVLRLDVGQGDFVTSRSDAAKVLQDLRRGAPDFFP